MMMKVVLPRYIEPERSKDWLKALTPTFAHIQVSQYRISLESSALLLFVCTSHTYVQLAEEEHVWPQLVCYTYPINLHFYRKSFTGFAVSYDAAAHVLAVLCACCCRIKTEISRINLSACFRS